MEQKRLAAATNKRQECMEGSGGYERAADQNNTSHFMKINIE